jgi:hypothetical protein
MNNKPKDTLCIKAIPEDSVYYVKESVLMTIEFLRPDLIETFDQELKITKDPDGTFSLKFRCHV